MSANSKDQKGEYLFDNNLSDLDTLLPPSSFTQKKDALKKYVSLPKFSGKLLVMFLGWYGLNALYVVENKVILNAVPLPWTLSSLQLTVGWLFAALYWGTGLREKPSFKSKGVFFKVFVPQGLCHLFVHLGAVVSMGIGAVSFTHIIKALEPLVTAVFSLIFLREVYNALAYVSLVPVVVGVGMASYKDVSFSWPAFWFAMMSNAGSSVRAIFAKMTMKNKNELGKNLDASNIYMVLTLVASVGSMALAYVTESKHWVPYWVNGTAKMTPKDKQVFLLRAFGSCVCYFLCNDFAFMCLGEINQLSHAIANTLKRIVLITTAVFKFNYKVTRRGVLGIAIALAGAFFYSILK
ncbi:glucose-6-phosphate/phosphate translocator [Theileria orientalis strain Shintoku]|uniref:Glucose-6-phosphate/phosphate translocator n=1 Tax=Theileria orientalis strain Shintoku TaxID=869250 RepID=J4CDF8_THEOR|nr:glucose-6-phosphate/phosphate translocator [Theileria orientalis strain Shintoku]PVC50610.1 glucose-6-phosphate/phosphate translocator [Theileria orientalis]BAM41067.1 glucose-6-phosphate/phosphate translocator [Theileria orientalis strain Shintoku]|eukprot:XP_009691368.1 glucose-6-phosphate/phosphate translocator [Theileria orientalis strain Shintoku]